MHTKYISTRSAIITFQDDLRVEITNHEDTGLLIEIYSDEGAGALTPQQFTLLLAAHNEIGQGLRI